MIVVPNVDAFELGSINVAVPSLLVKLIPRDVPIVIESFEASVEIEFNPVPTIVSVSVVVSASTVSCPDTAILANALPCAAAPAISLIVPPSFI